MGKYDLLAACGAFYLLRGTRAEEEYHSGTLAVRLVLGVDELF